MVWLIIGIFLVMMIGLAALVRSLRLDGALKTLLSIFSVISIALAIVALVCAITNQTMTFIRIFFYIGLGISILSLILAIHFLRKKHNKVFTDKTKEHHENVARILAQEQKDKEN